LDTRENSMVDARVEQFSLLDFFNKCMSSLGLHQQVSVNGESTNDTTRVRLQPTEPLVSMTE
jgi:hypothetical protein